jgi:hypothetical protein
MLNLTPTELFFVYETLASSIMIGAEQQENKQFVLSKVRDELINTLVSFKAESNEVDYPIWLNQESRRIDDLSKKNEVLKTRTPRFKERSLKKNINYTKTRSKKQTRQ